MIIKSSLCLCFLWCSCILNGQAELPYFLQGTWQMEDRQVYEKWDILGDQLMHGIVYEKTEGELDIKEYLKVEISDKNVLYSAAVRGQNEGNTIVFKGIKNDSSLVFENMAHDFPQRIEYHKQDTCTLRVRLSGRGYGDKHYNLYRCYPESSANAKYDRSLARHLGADDWGMKSYFFVILATGTASTDDKEFYSQCFRGHLDNIGQMVKNKKLILAGPLGRNSENYRGLFILDNVTTMEEAEQLLASDPAIKNGFLKPSIFEWYGSAALPLYLPYSDMIWQKKP